MLPRRFCDLVGCDRPLQLAGMGHIAGIELAAAVSNAGGLGITAMPLVPADRLHPILAELGQATDRPFGVNFLMPFLDLDCVQVAAEQAQVIEWFYATPDPDLVRIAHDQDALAGWQVGSISDAKAAVDAGCDYIVVQGIEAGGHIQGRRSLWNLLPDCRQQIELPLVAAGGLGTPAAVAAAFTAGADAVRIGTRFVAAVEADTHPDYVQYLIDATASDTDLTTTFSTMWPDAPHRVLRSSITTATDLTIDTVGEATLAGVTIPVPRLSPIAATTGFTGNVAAMPLYAGHSVDAVTQRQPAADIATELLEGAEALLAANVSDR